MLTIEDKKNQYDDCERELIADLLSSLTLVITVPVQPRFNQFVCQLSQHCYRLSQRLGIDVSVHSEENTSGFLMLNLTGSNWQVSQSIPLYDDNGSCFSEITLQAISGIMSVHSRSLGEIEALGIDYVTVAVAVNALTGLFAQAYAAIGNADNKIQYSKGSCSPLAVSLLSASQYIADATTQEKFPLPEEFSNIELQPPFRSLDGVDFEVESLDAKPWRQFWLNLAIDDELASKGWQAFQMRYAKAVSPLPKVMVDRLAQLTFTEIQEHCKDSGMKVTPVIPLSVNARGKHSYFLWQEGPWHFTSWISDSDDSLLKPLSANNPLPLAGVNIVESCRRIQGPLATHILSLLGADIIRIEPPNGDPLRGMPPIANGCSVRFDAINRNKNVVEINIKDSEGRKQILDLIEEANVFVHNWAPHKAEELGLDHDTMSLTNPSLVYSYASGWANTTADNAEYTQLPGTDFMVQAVSGVASMISTHSQSQKPKGGSLFTVLDTLGGAVAAQGIVLGLLIQRLYQRGCYLETSLLGAASILCDEALGLIYRQQYTSKNASLSGVFATQTENIAVHFPDIDTYPEVAQLLGITVSPQFAPQESQQRKNIIAQSLKCRPADEWVKAFAKLAIPVAVVCEDISKISELSLLQPWLEEKSYQQIKSPWRFS